jgi:cytochrome c peroxidase
MSRAKTAVSLKWASICAIAASFGLGVVVAQTPAPKQSKIGQEHAIDRHLQDDEEFRVPLLELIEYGKKVFCANWTDQDGAGRPLTKGTGKPISDPSSPLKGARAWNRVSGPDSNSCAGCHNQPYGIPGGGGDLATGVFVLGQRFDFVTFNPTDNVPTRGTVDERGRPVTLDTIANFRATTGMFGAGYLEMLAREMTEELQMIRDGMKRGETRQLIAKGISFGKLTRRADNSWDVSGIVGLPRASVLAPSPLDPPNLIIRPWHQAGNVVSLREFTNNAFNQHHGMQSTERFGVDRDPDGDGVVNELTRADITAASVFQAVLQVPGQVVPNDPEIERAILNGEHVFNKIGCATCHVPALPLSRRNWTYTEPNPFNPPTNLRLGQARTLALNLNDPSLPQPRLKPETANADALMVPAYTDFKLHDITDPNDEYGEPLDMNQTVWADKFRGGNRKFLTKRLWGAANEPPYFHHGMFTTLRASVLAHAGEALESRKAFEALPDYDNDSLIEFLKSLQVLPPGTKDLVVDENYKRKVWTISRIPETPASAKTMSQAHPQSAQGH